MYAVARACSAFESATEPKVKSTLQCRSVTRSLGTRQFRSVGRPTPWMRAIRFIRRRNRIVGPRSFVRSVDRRFHEIRVCEERGEKGRI